MSRKFSNSTELLQRSENVIPLGSQTFSKSRVQYPAGHSPLFIERGARGRVWDVDGNEYVDLVNGLLPVVLGYRDPDVDAAIKEQLEDGITFSLPSPLETELAERLVELIPCAEKVRFGKNGTDATSAAVRLARAFTRRDRIIALGYHGWQDWYIGATVRNEGVPDAVARLTHKLPYNDLPALEALLKTHPNEFAAVVMEPMSTEEPSEGYLEAVREITGRAGALLVFDEVITGFRFHIGGAQSYFGVVPDLAAFGKAMGNGMPISAVVGRADIMNKMEDVFFSGTFGGETLSLAAAIAVIDKMRREPVIDRLWKTGKSLVDGIQTRIEQHGLSQSIRILGKAPWTVLSFSDTAGCPGAALKTRFLIEALANGVLTIGGQNISYAHDEHDVACVLKAYDGAFSRIAAELDTGQLTKNLPVPPVEPVFSVRAQPTGAKTLDKS